MRYRHAFFVTLFLIPSLLMAQEAKTHQDPLEFIEAFFNESFNALKSINKSELSVEEKEAKLIELSRQYFSDRIFKLMLGMHYKKFNDEQFEKFTKISEANIARTIIVFLKSQEEKINQISNLDEIIANKSFTLFKKDEKRGYALYKVKYDLQFDKNAEAIDIEFSVINRNNQFKIYGVSFAGINYIINLRNAYNSSLEAVGYDADKFLDQLENGQ